MVKRHGYPEALEALCALRTPRSQARCAPASHQPESRRQGERSRVRDVPWLPLGRQFCPPSTGGSWPLGSCAPSPTAPTAPGWCLLLSHPPEHAHAYTRGLWAPQVLCFLSLRGDLLVHRRPMHPACWRLQSPALLTARFPRIRRAPWSLHRLRARSRACRLCGSPTTPHNRPEWLDWRIATAAIRATPTPKRLSPWAVGGGQVSHGAWEGTATPRGPWTPLFRRGARSHRRRVCLPPPAVGRYGSPAATRTYITHPRRRLCVPQPTPCHWGALGQGIRAKSQVRTLKWGLLTLRKGACH